ncbi:hypothetical protein EV2_029828 [Malus domestica]
MGAGRRALNQPAQRVESDGVRSKILRLFILWLAAKDWLGKVLLGSLSLYYLPLRHGLNKSKKINSDKTFGEVYKRKIPLNLSIRGLLMQKTVVDLNPCWGGGGAEALEDNNNPSFVKIIELNICKGRNLSKQLGGKAAKHTRQSVMMQASLRYLAS